MTELLSVLETLVGDVSSGRSAVFCVVLEKRGSAPREPGAAMLVRSDGGTVGTIGGGAVEVMGQRKATELLRGGEPLLLDLSMEEDHGADDASMCGGHITLGAVPVATAAQLEPFREALAAARRGESAHVPIVAERAGRRVEYRLNVEVPPTLIIAGAGHVGQAVARLATGVDFHVVVIDDRAAMASPERFGQRVELLVGDVAQLLQDYPIDASCYVAIMTRGHQHDQAALEVVVGRPAAYIGMIASRRKADTLLGALRESGVAQEVIERVRTPIGVPIDAVTVNEIAVSIVAELVQARRKRTPKLVEGPRAAELQ